MLHCEWARKLTSYECHALQALGSDATCLEIGTPFSLPDGSAINLYMTETQHGTIKISDNADTLFQLGGMGLDVWQPAREGAVRAMLARHQVQLGSQGDIYLISQPAHAAHAFALAITGLLAVADWASDQLGVAAEPMDIVAELEPYIIARNPSAAFKRHPHVKGASSSVHQFDFQHGDDLIDVIGANPNATGAAMRKAGDVQNGPFAQQLTPLIVVDDRVDPDRAMAEIGILGSVTRAMPATRLMQTLH